jgi:external thioesterase TEII
MPPTNYLKLAGGRIGIRQLRQSELSPSIQLLCFPYVGGHSLAFNPLAAHLPPDWDLWAVDPPGHGAAKGPVIDNLKELIAEYIHHIPWDSFQPVVLFGHSLGGYVVHTLATELLKYQRVSLLGAILCASKPYHQRSKSELYSLLDDATLLHKLVNMGGVPTDFVNTPEIFDIFKDVIRSDFRAFESCEPPQTLLAAPMLALGGIEDTFCLPIHMYEWQKYARNCDVDFVPGHHFCLQTHPRDLAHRIVTFMGYLGKN